MTTQIEETTYPVPEVSSTKPKAEPTPDGLGALGKDFKAPTDKQWLLRKQHPQRDGGNKNWPGHSGLDARKDVTTHVVTASPTNKC